MGKSNKQNEQSNFEELLDCDPRFGNRADVVGSELISSGPACNVGGAAATATGASPAMVRGR
jgi:hypothetical protein